MSRLNLLIQKYYVCWEWIGGVTFKWVLVCSHRNRYTSLVNECTLSTKTKRKAATTKYSFSSQEKYFKTHVKSFYQVHVMAMKFVFGKFDSILIKHCNHKRVHVSCIYFCSKTKTKGRRKQLHAQAQAK